MQLICSFARKLQPESLCCSSGFVTSHWNTFNGFPASFPAFVHFFLSLPGDVSEARIRTGCCFSAPSQTGARMLCFLCLCYTLLILDVSQTPRQPSRPTALLFLCPPPWQNKWLPPTVLAHTFLVLAFIRVWSCTCLSPLTPSRGGADPNYLVSSVHGT